MAHRQLTQAATTDSNDTLEAAWPGVARAATEWWKTDEPVEDAVAPESKRAVIVGQDVPRWPSAAAAACAWWNEEPEVPVRSVTDVGEGAPEITAEWPDVAAAAGAWWQQDEELRSGVYATHALEADLAQVA